MSLLPLRLLIMLMLLFAKWLHTFALMPTASLPKTLIITFFIFVRDEKFVYSEASSFGISSSSFFTTGLCLLAPP